MPETRIERKEIVKSIVIAVGMALVAGCIWVLGESISLDCITKSETESTNPNTGKLVRIVVVSCPLDPSVTTIELFESPDSEAVQVYRTIGSPELSAKWYYLDHVIVNGTRHQSTEIDLQVTKINGVKFEYKITDK